MAPVLILQFMADDAPAYLGTWLRRQGIEADVRLAEGGPSFPDRVDVYRALALLGGSMSVNDGFAYLRTAEQLIEARRPEDLGHSLWTTFQRVQENVIRGGQPGRSAQGRRLQTRPVGSIDRVVSLNRALWMLAEEMRKLKA